jgi:exosortase A-associated hydrolase 2
MIDSFIRSTAVTPGFMSGREGKLFFIYYPPLLGKLSGHVVIHIPAFAEEMNKSRRMVALQARGLAQLGYSVLVVDPWGTGDSEGEFGAASWELWKNDFTDICRALANRDFAVSLWGLRTGGLLAMDLACESGLVFECGLFWQPVFKGELFLLQLLRLRIAAAMMDGTAKEKTGDLKQRLLAGQSVEVGGYMLAPAVAKALLDLHEGRFNTLPFKKIAVLETAAESAHALSMTSRQFAERLQHAGADVTADAVQGKPFWSTQEIAEAPELLKASARFFAGGL